VGLRDRVESTRLQASGGMMWNLLGNPTNNLIMPALFFNTYKFTNEQSVLKTQALFLLVALQVLLVVALVQV